MSGQRFFNLVLRRLRSRLGLTLLSLLSVVLAVGMVVSIPVFAQGVSYLVLRDELVSLGNTFHRPPLTTRFYFVARRNSPLSVEYIHTLGDRFYNIISDSMGLPIQYFATYIGSPNLTLQHSAGDLRYTDTKEGIIAKDLHLSIMTEIEDYIEVVEGVPFGTPSDNEAIATWPYLAMAEEMGLQVGETYDMVHIGTENRIPIYIAGVWREADLSDFYWSGTTILWDKVFLVTETDYRGAVESATPQKTGFTAWYIVPDDTGLTLGRADSAASGLELAPSQADLLFPGTNMDVSPIWPLKQYLNRKASLTALLVGFSLPAMGLLFFFMWLLSTVTAQFQREEAAILAGRGASRRFLIGLSLAEALLLLGIGTPLGLGLGYGMARLMGFTSGFLAFVRRNEFPATLLEIDWRLLLIALVILIIARLIPTLGAAQAGIVHHLRQRSRPRRFSGLLKLAIDIPLVVLTFYAYQQLSRRGTLGIIGWEPSGDPFQDPLLLLTPSLFVFTCALVLTHLFPILMRPIDRLGHRLKSFSTYMGLRRLHREGGQYTGSLFLVMVCLSLGAFYASMALSLDEWLRERVYYRVGTDYRFRQGIPPPSMGGPMGEEEANPEVVNAWLLPINDYLEIPGVEKATRVGEFVAKPKVSNRKEGTFLAIDRLDFSQIAHFRNDFTQAAIGDLMNRLGMYPNGVLLSRRFMQRHRLLEGQRLTLDILFNYESFELEFLIVGVYDYFPTVYPGDREVFIGNLDHLFEQVGDEALHQIWMQTAPETTPEAIQEQLIEMGIWPVQNQDARTQLLIDEERVERIGLFGVLSVGFLATSILACLGLLVYTYASLQGRLQQISVLRAIGIKTRQVLAMVSIEYIGVIFYSVAVGTLLGIVTSYLFVPFFRVSGDPVFALPPFIRHIAWGKIGWLTLTFTIALLVSQSIILYGATRRDIFQILRMGQRE